METNETTRLDAPSGNQTTGLPADELIRILADEDARQVVLTLAGTDGRTIDSVLTFATVTTGITHTGPGECPPSEETRRRLLDEHIPRLCDAGIIEAVGDELFPAAGFQRALRWARLINEELEAEGRPA